jgi:preprotein translocase subunit SecG
MPWIVSLLVVVQVICAGAIIILVLLQHGKGADMGAAFGGGASGSLFGASGSANFLSRSTAVAATIFFVATIALAYSANSLRASRSGGLMSTAQPAAPAAPDAGQAVPQQVPGQNLPQTAPAAPGAAEKPAPADKSAAIPK